MYIRVGSYACVNISVYIYISYICLETFTIYPFDTNDRNGANILMDGMVWWMAIRSAFIVGGGVIKTKNMLYRYGLISVCNLKKIVATAHPNNHAYKNNLQTNGWICLNNGLQSATCFSWANQSNASKTTVMNRISWAFHNVTPCIPASFQPRSGPRHPNKEQTLEY